MNMRKRENGGSIVEFALMLPIALILIVNVVNFAGFFYAFVTVGSASRAAGDYAIMGSITYPGSDASGASKPTLTAPANQLVSMTTGGQKVANMVGTAMLGLPNRTSISIRLCSSLSNNTSSPNCNVCTNASGSMSCSTGSGSFTVNPAGDTSTGEGASYTLTWVDVSYTYQPFVPVNFSFPGLNFGVTLPSNLVLHRQAVFRVVT
jgi:Flp pilus assembly protein TadG